MLASHVAAWQRARDAERRLVHPIVEYARLTWGPDLFALACRFFTVGTYSRESMCKSLPMFDPWFAFRWIPNINEDEDDDDVRVAPRDWPTVPIAMAWLASGRAGRASAFDQAFIMRAAASPYSFLLVEAVRSGWSLTVIDLMTGRRLVVVDPEISARVRPDDLLLSAILTIGGVSTLLGPAPFTVPPDRHYDVAHLRRDESEHAWLTRPELLDLDADVDLFDEYRQACDHGPASVYFDAHEGEAREPLHLEWAVQAPFDDAFERLLPLSVCYEDEEAIDVESTPDGDPHVLMTWYDHPSPDPDDWRMLGALHLAQGRLTADVPTRARAERLIAEVAARCGPAAALVHTRSMVPVRVHDRESSLVGPMLWPGVPWT